LCIQSSRGTLQCSRGTPRVRSYTAECRVQRSALAREHCGCCVIGLCYALRFGACAAPTRVPTGTPAPTNVGETNPPTRTPTAPPTSLAPTLSPTRGPTLSPTFQGGARRVHSDAAESSDCRRPCAMVPTVPCSRVPPRFSGALPRDRGTRHGLRGAAAARTGSEYSRYSLTLKSTRRVLWGTREYS
jgi:hypothetical protein